MQKELLLWPRHFGPKLREYLVEKLISSVEGSCSGRYGFVVCVTEVFETGKGKIREGGGLAAVQPRLRRRRLGRHRDALAGARRRQQARGRARRPRGVHGIFRDL